MKRIEELKEKVKLNKKKIILPESSNEQVLEAASRIIEEDLVELVLLGNKDEIIGKYPLLNQVEWYNPENSELLDVYVEKLYELRKDKGMTKEHAKELLENDYMYFACMLVLDNKADGIVSGKTHTTSNTFRPALELIKGKEKLVSSFFLIETDNTELGEDGLFIFADCGLNQSPSVDDLALIGKQSIESFKLILESTPKVAFLSHSTYGSSNHPMVKKIQEATIKAKELCPNELIDGELQLDAAIIPDVANIKCPNSSLKGKANVLIFPDLDSGNIAYKLVERFGKALAYGPLAQGLNYPVNDLSRGSSVDDIIGVIIITALQANKNMI